MTTINTAPEAVYCRSEHTMRCFSCAAMHFFGVAASKLTSEITKNIVLTIQREQEKLSMVTPADWDVYILTNKVFCYSCGAYLCPVDLGTVNARLVYFNQQQALASRRLENTQSDFIALQLEDGTYCDLDCFAIHLCQGTEVYDVILEADVKTLPYILVDHFADITAIIHEDTVSFEQEAGQIIPAEGIYCRYCEAELYAPYEEEGDNDDL